MYRIHIHTEHGHTWTYGFSHTLPSVTTRGDAHTLCVLSHTRYRSLAATFAPGDHRSLGDSCTCLLALSAPLYPCEPRALSLFKFTQQSTSLLSCLVGKNIRRVILFEWVMLFNSIALIGNYIHRVNVIKGSLYSRVYGMKYRPTEWWKEGNACSSKNDELLRDTQTNWIDWIVKWYCTVPCTLSIEIFCCEKWARNHFTSESHFFR